MCREMIDARCLQDIKEFGSTEGGDVTKRRVVLQKVLRCDYSLSV